MCSKIMASIIKAGRVMASKTKAGRMRIVSSVQPISLKYWTFPKMDKGTKDQAVIWPAT